MQLIEPNTLTLKAVTIPQDATKEQWQDIHRQLVICKRASSRWLKTSRKFAAEKWGIDYVAETEVQIELDLGLELKDEETKVNTFDKSTGLVTIEGINQKFTLWMRKVEPQMKSWNREQLSRALELLAPIETKAAAIRQMLSAAQ